MAKRQENNTTTLLGLKDCKAKEMVGGDDRVIRGNNEDYNY